MRENKKRPKDLYVGVEYHRQVKIDAAQLDAEMGEVSEAALAAWGELSEEEKHQWIEEIRAAD